jgi:carboxymethylenebutenolidase
MKSVGCDTHRGGRRGQTLAVRRWVGFAVLLLALLGAACSSNERAEPTTSPPNARDAGAKWSYVQAPGGHQLLMGVVRSDRPGHHVGILLVTGTEGLNTDYPRFAHELAARGFDVAFGCWFGSPPPKTPNDPEIFCAGAPQFVGVSDAAVPDLDALVAGARSVLTDTSTLALVGFSRGGGVAMLRATTGATEPVVSIAGMVEGTTAWGQLPSEVNVVERASTVVAPVLLLHGDDDPLVPVQQARDMEAALRAGGTDVVAKYYPNADHGLAWIPAIRPDLVEQITEFLCARSTCAAGQVTRPTS